jgi:hypothetical protein
MFRKEILHELLLVLCIVGIRLLVAYRHVLQDFLHLGLETHVNHSVGLIKDNVGTLTQHQIAIFQNVNKTTWRGNDNLDWEEQCYEF